MHNAAHTQQCTLVFDYTRCPFDPVHSEAEAELARLWQESLTLVDRVDGEQIERGWADLVPMVKPTRMMASGKRHSVLPFPEAKL
ncbi:hypothetical protein C8R47DRAFT_1230242 [Mycena vitilis]|nr:hypothetical protein C8R47DRAFT_1230242 [Mycena vitilis]